MLLVLLTSVIFLIKDSRTRETREAGIEDGKWSRRQKPGKEKGGVTKSHRESRKVKEIWPITVMLSEDTLIWICFCCVAASHPKVWVQPSAPHYKDSWIGRQANTRTKLCEQVTPHRQYTESAAPSLPLLACLRQQERQHQTRPKRPAHKISRRLRTICFSSRREGKPRTFSKLRRCP